MSIEVPVSTSVSPFKDLYKKCYDAHLYVQSVFFEIQVYCLTLSLSHLLCVSHSLWFLLLSGGAGYDLFSFHILTFSWYYSKHHSQKATTQTGVEQRPAKRHVGG